MQPRLFILLFLSSAHFACGQAPAEADAKDAKPKWDAAELQKSIRKLSDTEFALGEIKINAETKTVSFPATLKIVKGPLEYLIVNEAGSAHEALFITKVNAFELNVALLLTGFKPSETFFRKTKPDSFPEVVKGAKIAPESSFTVVVDWTDEGGKARTNSAEDWVYNLDSKASATPGAWAYTGSLLNQNGDLAAQVSGNILALYVDANALANNPRLGNDNDDIWTSKPEQPKEGLPVTITLKMSLASEKAPNKPADPPSKTPEPAKKKS